MTVHERVLHCRPVAKYAAVILAIASSSAYAATVRFKRAISAAYPQRQLPVSVDLRQLAYHTVALALST